MLIFEGVSGNDGLVRRFGGGVEGNLNLVVGNKQLDGSFQCDGIWVVLKEGTQADGNHIDDWFLEVFLLGGFE